MSSAASRATTSVKLADGRTLSGIVMAQSEVDATVLADGHPGSVINIVSYAIITFSCGSKPS